VLNGVLASYHDYPGTEADKLEVEQEIRGKAFLATEFLGSSGDIKDPYPDDGDEVSLQKYRQCAQLWKGLISPHIARVTEFLKRPALNKAMKSTVAFGTRRLSP
jgi:hypothetical protein